MNQSTDTSIEAHSTPVPSRRNAVWYCILLLAIPLAAIAASVLVVCTNWFLPRSGNFYIPNVGYGAKLDHANCQILIAGDSSALVGVIPAVVERGTGLTTCNIAEFGGMEQVNGRMMIDRYLARNTRPKFIVFMYVPENMASHETWTDVSHFEAVQYRIRTKPDLAILRSLLARPKEALSFATLSLRLALEALVRKPLPVETMQFREQHRGWIAAPGTVLSQCLPGHAIQRPDPAFLATLRAEYGVQGSEVLVDVTPMPACDPDYGYYVSRLPGIIDNQLEKYPVQLYNDSGRLHLIENGAERFSEEVAQQILKRQNSGSPTN